MSSNDRKHTVSKDTIEDGRVNKHRVRFRMNKKGISKLFSTEKEARSTESMLIKMFAEMGFSEDDLKPTNLSPKQIDFTQDDVNQLIFRIRSLIESGKIDEEFTYDDLNPNLSSKRMSLWSNTKNDIADQVGYRGKAIVWKLKEVQDENEK